MAKESPVNFIAERFRNGGVIHRQRCGFWKGVAFGSMVEIPPGADERCDCGYKETKALVERVAEYMDRPEKIPVQAVTQEMLDEELRQAFASSFVAIRALDRFGEPKVETTKVDDAIDELRSR